MTVSAASKLDMEKFRKVCGLMTGGATEGERVAANARTGPMAAGSCDDEVELIPITHKINAFLRNSVGQNGSRSAFAVAYCGSVPHADARSGEEGFEFT